MSLGDRLSEDLKQAMKARDQLRMDVIRMIKAAILNKEVELKKDLDVSVSELASAKFEVQSALKEVDAKQHELDALFFAQPLIGRDNG